MKKIKRIFVNKYDRKKEIVQLGKEDYSKTTSLTKQGDVLSIREILNKSANGIEFLDHKTPFYEEEAILSGYAFNKVQHMDFAERAEFYGKVSEETKRISDSIKEFNKKEAARIAAEKEKAQKRLEWQEQQMSKANEAKDDTQK